MMRALRTVALGLAMAGYFSCSGGGHHPPGPPSPPAPTPPSPICEEGATCGCWHQPPGAGWQQLPPCVPPTPNPPPVPPTTGCVLSGEPGPLLPGYRNTLGARVNAAMHSLTGCDVGSRCIVIVRPQVWQAHVEAALRAEGLCAGQHEPGTDEIAVASAPGQPWEGFHIYGGAGWDDPNATGTVVWSPGADRPAYAPPDGVVPTPPPTPTPTPPAPPASGCSEPLPPKVWTAATLPDGWGADQIGQPRWEIGCVQHGSIIDCTAKVAPHACGYCDAIGMGNYPDGQLRCGCPVRSECLGFKCEERAACEAYLTGGTRLEARNAAVCEFVGGNPFQFRPNEGNCRLCSIGDPRVCGGWF